MDEVDERKLQEPFVLHRDQCSILLEAIETICKDFKYYQNELELKILDDELSDYIDKLTGEIVEKDVNLKNTLACIQSSCGEMQSVFSEFRVDEDREAFCPNYEIQLKKEIDIMNKSEITKREIEENQRYLHIKELINELESNMIVDEDFAEIDGDVQLDKMPIDPFTQKEIDIPVRNKKCRHVYDKCGVTSYINQRNQKGKECKCPTIGCRSILTFNDLIEDLDLKEKIDRLKNLNS